MATANSEPQTAMRPGPEPARQSIARALAGYSIEVMPATAAKIADFREVLPPDTRIYVAQIEGTPIDDMVDTARRIAGEGFPVMPHITARTLRDKAELEIWIRRFVEEAGIREALLLAGGAKEVAGEFTSSIELLRTGLFDRYGFRRLHVAGHPEGNPDIDPPNSTERLDEALRTKQAWSNETDATMAIATQFCFEPDPVLAWARRLREMGITLPVHVGIAGPAKVQTLIRYALACGVGNSLRVLQRRAARSLNLLRPYPPDSVLEALGAALSSGTAPNIAGIHVFPFGGIRAAAEWARDKQMAATSED